MALAELNGAKEEKAVAEERGLSFAAGAGPAAGAGDAPSCASGRKTRALDRCRGPWFRPSAPKFLQRLQLGIGADEAGRALGRVGLSDRCWGDVTRMLKVSHHHLTLVRALAALEEGSWGQGVSRGGAAAGLVTPGRFPCSPQGFLRTRFSQPPLLWPGLNAGVGSCKQHLDTKQNLLPEGLFLNRQESSDSAALQRALRAAPP